ncbi:zinc-binding alcohol dehydrogenase family protein [Staphylococcus gallinarum]|uniref:zinc-binding alcohol dehydrogenase family protein n=1 Tax=Staphylococcus gallinarum TaxID=1293 RepID=UPI000E693A73|nr:zinc-binding alcohol dehydrogenase family protein [Staphylococcus gallinarum]MCD8909417.1 zinc-binding alcohol dehydrogenase family protein [Staphylococcus gallinarum]RIO80195.1 zinc-binding alcohol dehydrogenase family protein [Staphylococcus gallinarum]
MKKVKVLSKNNMVFEETEIPKPNETRNILVKTKRVGICGSDRHILHGQNPLATLPRVVGHEVVGVVEEIYGESTLKVGQHVVIEPISSCGECYACKQNRPNVCKELVVFGVHEDGGLQEYFTINEKQLHPVNNDIPFEKSVLIEPLTIGAQATYRANIQVGDTILIQGAGPIGLCILKHAKLTECTVIISDLDQTRLDYAKQQGADITINIKNSDLISEINKITNDEGVNVSIDAVCTPKTFELGTQVTSPAGRVVVLGFAEQPAQISQLPITKNELTILGSRLQTHQFKGVIKHLENGAFDNFDLVTQQFELNDVIDAFKFIDENPTEVRKAIIKF